MFQFAYSDLAAALRTKPTDAQVRRRLQAVAQMLGASDLTKNAASAAPKLLRLADTDVGYRLAVTVQARFELGEMQSASAVLEFVPGDISPVVRVATFYFGAPRRYLRAQDSQGRELPVSARRTVVQLEEDETCSNPECPFMSGFVVPLDLSLLRTLGGRGLQIMIEDDHARRLMIIISASAIDALSREL
jgi:hypothetical protein